MLALINQNIRHIIRTRLLLAMFLFSFLIQFLGVRVTRAVTVQIQGVVSTFDSKDSLFVALLFQLFTGVFVSAVYGIWMVPYAHQGPRSPLTFTLPISKWMFPLAYAISMLLLLLLQNLILGLSFGFNFGFDVFRAAHFPWRGLLSCLILQTAAFEVFMFAFASCSMVVGQIPTFFLGLLAMFLLQMGGVAFRFGLDRVAGTAGMGNFEKARAIYEKLPPVGDLVYDLRFTFLRPEEGHPPHLRLWLAWLAVTVLLFRFQLRFPGKSRASLE